MKNEAQRATFLSSLGAGFEYYDFIVYGMMAEILSPLFFPTDLPWLGLIKTFAIFAVGYLIRPIGGIFFGCLGDTFGRKTTFMTVMLLMALATFSIGLLPTYAQIGYAAPCLLLLFRILQGLSFGAELPGAITVVCEFTKQNQKGENTGFVIASTSIGAALASLILYSLTKLLDPKQIAEWGWRLPFLLGGVLAFINYLIRKYLTETPEFSDYKKESPKQLCSPIRILFPSFLKNIFYGMGLTCFTSSLVIFAIYLPTFLPLYFGYLPSDIYLATFLGMLASALILPFAGRLADRWGHAKLLKWTSFSFMLGVFPLISVLHLQSFTALVAFIFVLQFVLAFASVCIFPLLASLFSTPVRFTGIAACYNMTYSIISLSPLLMTFLLNYFGNAFAITLFLSVCAGIALLSAHFANLNQNPNRGLVLPVHS